jgi:hypothetical protein
VQRIARNSMNNAFFKSDRGDTRWTRRKPISRDTNESQVAEILQSGGLFDHSLRNGLESTQAPSKSVGCRLAETGLRGVVGGSSNWNQHELDGRHLVCWKVCSYRAIGKGVCVDSSGNKDGMRRLYIVLFVCFRIP